MNKNDGERGRGGSRERWRRGEDTERGGGGVDRMKKNDVERQ